MAGSATTPMARCKFASASKTAVHTARRINSAYRATTRLTASTNSSSSTLPSSPSSLSSTPAIMRPDDANDDARFLFVPIVDPTTTALLAPAPPTTPTVTLLSGAAFPAARVPEYSAWSRRPLVALCDRRVLFRQYAAASDRVAAFRPPPFQGKKGVAK